ncbi:MAG: hypothetical protein IJC13_05885 [Clostridia bacterium]|nr:hypothetical protein [Clostridia bacterium]
MKHKLHGSTRIAEKFSAALTAVTWQDVIPYFGTLSAVVTESQIIPLFHQMNGSLKNPSETAFCINDFDIGIIV